MKYFNIQGINKAISLIREGDNTQEHITSRATNAMINHYFLQRDDLYTTPEQIQEVSKKRPDYTIEHFSNIHPFFKPHVFVEVKSLVNSNIGGILDQVYDSIIYTVDLHGGSFSCFVIAMKGTKIAFYTYHNFSSLLDEYGIPHYRGFIPLNYILPFNLYARINRNGTPQMYQDYVNSRSTFMTDSNILEQSGALKTGGLEHSHILDLVNNLHKEDIHSMFSHVVQHSSDLFL